MWWIHRKRSDGKQGLGDRWEAGEQSDANGGTSMFSDSEWPLDPDLPTTARMWLTPYEWVNL